MTQLQRIVTVIYCCDGELEIYRKTHSFNINSSGDMVIPESFKEGKTIVALCAGEVDIINSIGNKLTVDF